MLPKKIAFVDVETTGLSATDNRVIEICIVRVEDGKVVSEYSSLINPQTSIPRFITHHTGITPAMVKNAPTFAEVMSEVQTHLDDCYFAAHNVGFDYSFIGEEYRRLGQALDNPYFCTAQLSRRLYPQHRRHGLDYVINRFGFDIENRHRALDDAQILWQFYQAVQSDFAPHLIAACL